MPKITLDELTRLAFVHAETDRRAMLGCYVGCTSPEDEKFKTELKDLILQLMTYRRKRWGKTRGEDLE